MVCIRQKICLKCHKEKLMNINNKYCGECTAKELNRKRREHFGALDALTIEERLRKIEEWQYDHMQDHIRFK